MLDSFTKSLLAMVLLASCSTTTSSSTQSDATLPIENPFGSYTGNSDGGSGQNVTLRTRRGDQSVEVELPRQGNDDLVVPMNPKFQAASQASVGSENVSGVDYQYKEQKATSADREIASTFNSASSPAEEARKRDIESSLGLQASDEAPHVDESYLAKMDVVRQLFKTGRYEAAMIEIDQLVKVYPTNARLYQMRGTVLDRLGYADLALRSWKQALELDPSDLALKKIVDKREQGTPNRRVASEAKR